MSDHSSAPAGVPSSEPFAEQMERIEAIRNALERLYSRGDEYLTRDDIWVIYGRHWPEDLRALLAIADAAKQLGVDLVASSARVEELTKALEESRAVQFWDGIRDGENNDA